MIEKNSIYIKSNIIKHIKISMEVNKNKNIFLYEDSNSKQSCHSYNIGENEINKRYKYLAMKMEEDNIDNKEEKYQNYLESRKKNIFNKNYGKKISLYTQSNLDTSNKSKSKSKRNLIQKNNIQKKYPNPINENEKEDLTLDQYREKIKKKYEEDNIYFANIDEENPKYCYLFSFCFFCHFPAFAYKDHISCINKCIDMKIRTNEFSENYTLDNFLESHYEYSSNHFECGGDIIPLFIDEKNKEPYFICNVCDNEIFKKLGIKL